MLVYCYAEIARPFEKAEAALLRVPDILTVSAVGAYREGEQLRARIGPAGLPFAKVVRLSVGPALRRGDRTTVPLSWEATGPAGLFPRMVADLVLEPLGADYSHLSFSGSYDPPLGPLGGTADRLLLHRVAEATVKRFTDELATALVEADPAQLAVPVT